MARKYDGIKVKYLFFILLALIYSPSSFACSCRGGTYERSFEYSDSVFIGIVESAKEKIFDVEHAPDYVYKLVQLEVTLRVSENFKGQEMDKLVVYTGSNYMTACGVPFKVGKKYLVFAQIIQKGEYPDPEPAGELGVNICNGTSRLKENLNENDHGDIHLHEYIEHLRLRNKEAK